ncbi:hypothetical protein OUZ56_032347 [Daphnia magna]|uniref:Acyl carrier protein n=1 Tax=Daphnia magna TaxID=35525 RepID=A0ABR0B8N3_9CRUS|nr:hypothetical protein OUZ56_032347 [Daphnia magna]
MAAGDVHAQALFTNLYARIGDRHHENAALKEGHVHEQRLPLFPAHDRHDVRVAHAEVEAGGGQLRPHVFGLLVELGDERRAVVLKHRQDRRRRGDDGDGEGGGEEERPRRVLDEVDDRFVREEDAADPAENLREGADDDRNLTVEAKVLDDAGAVLAEGAGAVGVVDDEAGVVALANFNKFGDFAHVAVEAVDAVDKDERILPLAGLEDALQALGGVVIEKANLRPILRHAGGEEGPIQNARVGVGIEDERGVLVGERHDGADHRLVAGREREAVRGTRTTSRGGAQGRRARSSSPARGRTRGRTRISPRRRWQQPSPSGGSSGREGAELGAADDDGRDVAVVADGDDDGERRCGGRAGEGGCDGERPRGAEGFAEACFRPLNGDRWSENVSDSLVFGFVKAGEARDSGDDATDRRRFDAGIGKGASQGAGNGGRACVKEGDVRRGGLKGGSEAVDVTENLRPARLGGGRRFNGKEYSCFRELGVVGARLELGEGEEERFAHRFGAADEDGVGPAGGEHQIGNGKPVETAGIPVAHRDVKRPKIFPNRDVAARAVGDGIRELCRIDVSCIFQLGDAIELGDRLEAPVGVGTDDPDARRIDSFREAPGAIVARFFQSGIAEGEPRAHDHQLCQSIEGSQPRVAQKLRRIEVRYFGNVGHTLGEVGGRIKRGNRRGRDRFRIAERPLERFPADAEGRKHRIAADDGVVAAESETVVEENVVRTFACLVGDDGDVALGIGRFVAHGRRVDPGFNGHHAADRLQGASGPHAVADRALHRRDRHAAIAKDLVHDLRFRLIIRLCSGPVGVHEIDVGGREAAPRNRLAHRADGAGRIGVGTGDVVGVAGDADRTNFSDNIGISANGVGLALEHNDPGPFADDEPLAVLVEGLAAVGRHRRKADEAGVLELLEDFRRSGDDDIGLAGANEVGGDADRVVPGRARPRERELHPLGTKRPRDMDRQERRRELGNEGTFYVVGAVANPTIFKDFEDIDLAHRRPDDDGGPRSAEVPFVDLRIGNRHAGRRERHRRRAPGTTGLRRGEVVFRAKLLDLTAERAPELRCVEGIDRGNARPPRRQSFVKRLLSEPNRAHDADAGDVDPCCHAAPLTCNDPVSQAIEGVVAPAKFAQASRKRQLRALRIQKFDETLDCQGIVAFRSTDVIRGAGCHPVRYRSRGLNSGAQWATRAVGDLHPTGKLCTSAGFVGLEVTPSRQQPYEGNENGKESRRTPRAVPEDRGRNRRARVPAPSNASSPSRSPTKRSRALSPSATSSTPSRSASPSEDPMSNDALRAEIHDLIVEIAEIDELPADKTFKDLGIDSMMGVEIVAAIERKYQIKIEDSELEKVSTLNSSVAIVAEKIAKK